MSSASGGDAAVVALTVFLLSFAILTGTGVSPGGRPGSRALLSARRIRLLISLGLAGVVAAWTSMRR